jgi:hypothetical protein
MHKLGNSGIEIAPVARSGNVFGETGLAQLNQASVV